MGSTLNPYIAFKDGQARAAAEFYQGVFGGELDVNTFGEFGAPEGTPPDGSLLPRRSSSDSPCTLSVSTAR